MSRGCEISLPSGAEYLAVSLSLEVEDPGREALGGHDHATSVRKVGLAVELDLQVRNLARVKRTWQLRRELEVRVVEVDGELALLVEWVLEVDADGLGPWHALDWTLRLRSARLAEQEARVLHALWAGQLEHAAAVADREGLVAHVERHLDAALRLSCSCRHLSHVCLEVAGAWSIDAFDLHRVVRLLLEEVAELEGLHLVLAEGALEGKRPLRSWCQASQDQLVVEVAKDWVLQGQVSLTVRNHQRKVANLELARLLRLQNLDLGIDLDILVLDLELAAVDLDLLAGGVFDDDRVRSSLTDGALKLDGDDL